MTNSDIHFSITNAITSNYKINEISDEEEELEEETKLNVHFEDLI